MKRRSIRFKMGMILFILALSTGMLAFTGLYAVNLHKNQVRDVAWRVGVLPVAGRMGGIVETMQSVLGELREQNRARLRLSLIENSDDRLVAEGKFQKSLFELTATYNEYQKLLENRVAEVGIDERFKDEFTTVNEIRRSVRNLDDVLLSNNWSATEKTRETAQEQLTRLKTLTAKLPNDLHEELQRYSHLMKHRARWLIVTVLFYVALSFVLVFLLVRLFYVWIFKPLKILVEGSRKVAEGTFQYRIRLESNDEMAELAEAMNGMTQRFEDIREDLDQKVQERSRELIRSERLASVGFLAAGVAHEINNPLMAISTCAESLQRRIVSILAQNGRGSDETEFAKRYLKMIQDEAFRCKGITEKLLSFARSETKEREKTDFVALVADIVEITKQHGDFKHKTIRLELPESLEITVNPQEIKQVVLNLLTNALNCTDNDGIVTIGLRREKDRAVLTVADNGFGMDENLMKNIFEPFFTQRKQGQGTGLGLSITHRIVEDHQGRITALSDGPGLGSTFVIDLPIEGTEN